MGLGAVKRTGYLAFQHCVAARAGPVFDRFLGISQKPAGVEAAGFYSSDPGPDKRRGFGRVIHAPPAGWLLCGNMQLRLWRRPKSILQRKTGSYKTRHGTDVDLQAIAVTLLKADLALLLFSPLTCLWLAFRQKRSVIVWFLMGGFGTMGSVVWLLAEQRKSTRLARA
jgi:hypothetical protein